MDNRRFDAISVFGTQLIDNRILHPDLVARLDKAMECYIAGISKKIIVSGKWTIWNDWRGVRPPITEAAAMKRYLTDIAVPARDVVTETKSKDTIGNVYYLKQYKKKHPEIANFLHLSAPQRLERTQFLFGKIFGPDADISYEIVDAPGDEQNQLGSEKASLIAQRRFLAEMVPGDDSFLEGKLYRDPYYSNQRKVLKVNS